MFRHGDLKSREIREQTGLSRGSKNYHFGVLQEWGLIEEIGRDESTGGHPERVFGLTDEGREFTAEYLTDESERPDSYELRVQRLEDEVDDLKTATERLGSEIEQLRKDREDAFGTFLDRLENKLNGEYRTMIEQSIKNDLELDSDHE